MRVVKPITRFFFLFLFRSYVEHEKFSTIQFLSKILTKEILYLLINSRRIKLSFFMHHMMYRELGNRSAIFEMEGKVTRDRNRTHSPIPISLDNVIYYRL